MSEKPVIFISYSHLDEPEHPSQEEVRWLTFVQRFLRPAVKDGRFEVWVDRQMEGGTDWDPEIERRLRECDVFVLLVSAHSMASDYVIDKEIAIIRERQANGESVHFYPIMLTPTPQAGRDKVKDKNLRPRDGAPLSKYGANDRMQHMSDISDEIAAIVEDVGTQKAVDAPKKPKATVGIKIEIAGLPETPYVNLVGRDDELKKLDAAWADERINVISLVAEGGAGKSSLLNEWLARLQARGYAGAEVVLGWSFYSQGSKERTTSAEGFLSWAIDQLGLTPSSNTVSAKATAIAEALMQRHILLALDGVEPLQHGPGPELGKLKDLGLRELLRRVAGNPPNPQRGLIVLTTRTVVLDIDRWRKTSSSVIELDKLNDVAGTELLKDNGVWGTAEQLKDTVEAFGGHALALSLVAGFLRETQNGDVRRRDHIRQIAYDDDDPRHAHAKRVIKSYADEWLANEPVLDSIVSLVGLFDRPADAECLGALRREPGITGLTDRIVGVSDADWNKAVGRLRAARLLLPVDPTMPSALDAHPLVREWFGERLKVTNGTAWRSAHSRLYEHLRETTAEGDTPSLEDFAPLYQAIAHGCSAERHEEALEEIYRGRIARRLPDNQLEYYSKRMLGAFGSDLAALSSFFEFPFHAPVAALRAGHRSWLLSEAAICLRTSGRFGEAISADAAGLRMDERASDWYNAAQTANNISEAKLLTGNISEALEAADLAIKHAQDGDAWLNVVTKTGQADVLHAFGRASEALHRFVEAEQLFQQEFPRQPLFSTPGYKYCEFLLTKGEFAAVRERATAFLQAYGDTSPVLDRSLFTLLLARTTHRLVLDRANTAKGGNDQVFSAHSNLNRSVESLTGRRDYSPRGHLARAAFRRSTGDWGGAHRDFDEVEEVAELGPMRLYLCDLALQRARVAFGRIEAFAPLNGMLERGQNAPKPEVPSPEKIAELKAEAEKQIKIADDYIQSCGYHRRDEELAELKDVRDRKRTFASLPPRV